MNSETPAVLKGLDLLTVDVDGAIARVSLARPAKRNAISDALIAQLHTCFINLPQAVRAVDVDGQQVEPFQHGWRLAVHCSGDEAVSYEY